MSLLSGKFLFSKSLARSISILLARHTNLVCSPKNKLENAVIGPNISTAILISTLSRTAVTMAGDSIKTANYEDMLNYEKKSSILIVDVREPKELQESGQIPGSINIPLGEVQSVFQSVSDDGFKAKYGRDKPSFDTPLVFHCRSGKRSAAALDIVQKLGFKDLTNYSGGWLDWEEHIKKQ